MLNEKRAVRSALHAGVNQHKLIELLKFTLNSDCVEYQDMIDKQRPEVERVTREAREAYVAAHERMMTLLETIDSH